MSPALVPVKAFHALHWQLTHGQRSQSDGEVGSSPRGLALGYAQNALKLQLSVELQKLGGREGSPDWIC